MAAKGLNWKGLRAGLNHEDVAVLVVGMPVRSKFFYRAKDGVDRGQFVQPLRVPPRGDDNLYITVNGDLLLYRGDQFAGFHTVLTPQFSLTSAPPQSNQSLPTPSIKGSINEVGGVAQDRTTPTAGMPLPVLFLRECREHLVGLGLGLCTLSILPFEVGLRDFKRTVAQVVLDRAHRVASIRPHCGKRLAEFVQFNLAFDPGQRRHRLQLA